MILHGKNLIVKLDGEAIAAAKTCKLTIRSALTEVSDPLQGAWERHIPDLKSWSVNVGGLVIFEPTAPAGHLITVARLAGQLVHLTFSVVSGSEETQALEGDAYCDTADLAGAKGNLSTYAYKFTGNGPLSEVNPQA